MDFQQQAKYYYIDLKQNCAVSILMGANDRYGLGLSMEDAKLVIGFGGGMGCGSTCGCVAGSMAVLGKLYAGRPDFRKLCSGFVKEFRECLGSTDCAVILPAHTSKDNRCLSAVLKAAALLEAYIAKIEN